MARRIECFSCRQGFEVPDDLDPGPLTCPRCQSAIDLYSAESLIARRMRAGQVIWGIDRGPLVLVGLTAAMIVAAYIVALVVRIRSADYAFIEYVLFNAWLFVALAFFACVAFGRAVYRGVIHALQDDEEQSPWQQVTTGQSLCGAIATIMVCGVILFGCGLACGGILWTLQP